MGDPLGNATAAARGAGAPTLDCPVSEQGGSRAFNSLSFSLNVKADLIRSPLPHMHCTKLSALRGDKILPNDLVTVFK